MKFLPFTTLAFCLFLAACADKPAVKPTEKADPESKPQLVGRVASIPADRTFVLIQSYGIWNVETGAVLTSQGTEGRTANLLATGEKLGQYAAADIRTGTLEVGDGVYTIAKVPTPTDAIPKPPTPQKSAVPVVETAD